MTWEFKVGNIRIWIRTYMDSVYQHLICPVFLTCVRSLYLLIWVTHHSPKRLPYLKYFAINLCTMMYIHLNMQLYDWSALLYFTNNAQLVFIDSQLAPISWIMVKKSCFVETWEFCYFIIHHSKYLFAYMG